MKRIFSFQFIILALVFSGCASNLSRNPFIEGQLHRRLVIQRECLLASGTKSWDEVEGGHEDWFRGAPFQLYDKDDSDSWRRSGWIEPGTELTLEKVVYRESFETEYIDAYGTLYLKGRDIPFWYSWKYLSGEPALKRAPWEPNEVPEFRPLKQR